MAVTSFEVSELMTLSNSNLVLRELRRFSISSSGIWSKMLARFRSRDLGSTMTDRFWNAALGENTGDISLCHGGGDMMRGNSKRRK
jgi:hypothetical protein